MLNKTSRGVDAPAEPDYDTYLTDEAMVAKAEYCKPFDTAHAEKKLLVAVMQRALQDLVSNDKGLVLDVIEWIEEEEDENECLSYNFILMALDMESVDWKIRELVAGAKASMEVALSA